MVLQLLRVKWLLKREGYVKIWTWNNRVTGWLDLHFILHRMGVVLMKFDFKDLMAFGMFILALLTFVFTFSS